MILARDFQKTLRTLAFNICLKRQTSSRLYLYSLSLLFEFFSLLLGGHLHIHTVDGQWCRGLTPDHLSSVTPTPTLDLNTQ